MSLLIKAVLALSVIVFIVLTPSTAQALDGSAWNAGKIIDDSIFYKKGDISPGDIQAFLNSKVATCDTWGTKPYGNTTRANHGASRGYPAPYTCLKDFSMDTQGKAADSYCSGIGSGRKSAATIIYEVSNACEINSKVLIVMLEKEQGLISDDWPWSLQYRGAMGYGCPDTAPCDSEYYGFFNQVYNAARQYKVYAQNPGSYRYKPVQNNFIYWNPNLDSCGGSNVFINNKATAGLYNYTPYQPNSAALNNLYGEGDGCSAYGNRNFWRLYNDWFGSTVASFSIMKKSDSPQLYLYDGSVKYLIPTWEIYLAYGYDRYTGFTLSNSYIDSIPTGGTLTNLSRSNGGVVYLNANGKRYAVSPERCAEWGLDCFNPYALNTISNDALGLTPQGGELKRLLENRGTVYRMSAGKKEPFLSYEAMSERGYNWADVTTVEDMNAQKPLGDLIPHQSAAIKFASSSSIYIYQGDQFYTVPDYDTFVNWRIDKFYVPYHAPSSYSTTPPTSAGNLSNLLKINNVVYLINNGDRVDITNVASEWPAPLEMPALSNIVSKLPYRKIDDKTSLRTNSGAIFIVEDEKRRNFQSVNDFYDLGYNPDSRLDVSDQNVNLLQPGPSLLALKAPFKKPGSGQIFVTNSTGTSLAIPTYEHFVAYRLLPQNVRNVSTATAAQYPSGSELSSFMNRPNGERAILSTQDIIYNASVAVSNAWGIPSSTSPFTPDVLPQQKMSATRFARTNNGQIYYADGGCKRPITSYDKFVQLGGNNDNVMHVFNDFVDSLCTGVPL